MNTQDIANIALTDEELKGAAGGAGQWVASSRGQGWVWQESQSSVSGNAGAFHASSSSSTSSVRNQLIDGKRHFYKFDGNKELLVGIR